MKIDDFISTLTRISNLLDDAYVKDYQLVVRLDYDDTYIELPIIENGSKIIEIHGN